MPLPIGRFIVDSQLYSQIVLTRTLPTSVASTVELGNVQTTTGAHSLFISVRAVGSAQVLKQYSFSLNADHTGGNWFSLEPLNEEFDPLGEDFQIDVRSSGLVAEFRVRRSTGTGALTATITIQNVGAEDGTFAETSGTGAGATVAGSVSAIPYGAGTTDHNQLANRGTYPHSAVDAHIVALAPHAKHENTDYKNVANGYAGLTASAYIRSQNIPFGTDAGTVCEGNDIRLQGGLPPGPHASTHNAGGSDEVDLGDLAGILPQVKTHANNDLDQTTSSLHHTLGTNPTQAAAGNHLHTGVYALAGNGVTNGDAHDHSGGDGAQIAHTSLSGIGVRTHLDIDNHIDASAPHTGHEVITNKDFPLGYPGLDAGGLISINAIPTGSTVTTVCIGNDPRLSDSRTPTIHASSHYGGGSDPLTLSSMVGNLDQDRTHDNSDFDQTVSSLHHTLGTSPTQAAAGNHLHTGVYAPSGEGVTNGNAHDHSGGDGAQISHTSLSGIGTYSHLSIDAHINTSAPHPGHEKLINKDSNGGYVGIDGTGKMLGYLIPYGSLANTACEGNDSRLSDSRPPTAHATSHSTGQPDQISLSNLEGNLTQSRSHDSADTDGSPSALHHTLGTGANQAAPGNHDHTSSYDLLYAPIAKGVTNGDSHDHSGGDGAQIDHASLTSIGTNSHASIDLHLAASSPHSGHEITSNKNSPEGYAGLSGGKLSYSHVPIGSVPNTVCAGDDSRLTDSRPPTSHADSHEDGGSDSIVLANLTGNLDQARSHDNNDKDSSPSSLHHSLGYTANQAAPGPHTHDGINGTQVDHDDLLNKGALSHSTLDTHVGTPGIHREIDDNTPTLTTTYSGTKVSTELGLKEDAANKGAINGYCPLDGDQLVPLANIPASVKESKVVADITARGAITPLFEGLRAHVLDASDDPTVTSGSAGYIYTGVAWEKTYEGEALDVVLDWSDIQNKPTSSVADIDDAVSKRHVQGTDTVLDNGGANQVTASQIVTHHSASAPHSGHELTSNKNAANGYAGLSGGLIDGTQVPYGSLADTACEGNDSRLSDDRNPIAHVIATNTGLGARHTISGAATGHVLRASSATAANFQQLAHSDLGGVGTNDHAAIDSHISALAPHSGHALLVHDHDSAYEPIISVHRTLYVSTKGSDTTGTGTLARPYRTVTKAITEAKALSPVPSWNNEVAISIEPGSYAENITLDHAGISLFGSCQFETKITGADTVLTITDNGVDPEPWNVHIQGISFIRSGGTQPCVVISGLGGSSLAGNELCFISCSVSGGLSANLANYLTFQDTWISGGATYTQVSGIWLEDGQHSNITVDWNPAGSKPADTSHYGVNILGATIGGAITLLNSGIIGDDYRLRPLGTTAGTICEGNDSRLSDSRTPTSHVLATNAGLGPLQTISGATAGHVLRASSATAANFQQLSHADLGLAGTNTHAQIDSHIAAAAPHSGHALSSHTHAGTDITSIVASATYANTAGDADTVDGLDASAFAPASHTHGGGDITSSVATANALTTARSIGLTGGVTGSALFDGSTNISITATVTNNSHTHTGGNITSAVATASALATARNIALIGDVTGNANFDGSANISITATVANDSHTHTGANITSTVASADTVDGYHASGGGGASKIIATEANGYLHVDNWIRSGPLTGLFNSSGGYVYQASAASWAIRSHTGQASNKLSIQSGAGTEIGSLYAEGPNQGFLAPGTANWVFRLIGNDAELTGNMDAASYYVTDASTALTKGTSNTLRITTPTGYVDIGSQNGSFCHIETDRALFYFNKEVQAATALRVYGTNSYIAATAGYIAGNAIWHAGNFNPASYAPVSHVSEVLAHGFKSDDGTRAAYDYNTLLQTGSYGVESTGTNGPGSAYSQVLVSRGIDTGLQIAGGYAADNLYFRGWYSSGAGFTPWRTLIHSGNIGSQSVASASNADTVDGYHANAGIVGNNIVVRHASGYIFSNYFNMTADLSTATATKMAVNNGSDDYLRWQTPAQFIANHGISTAGHGHTGNQISASWTNATTDVETSRWLRWKNYGNSHVILDASASTGPGGEGINNTNAAVPWSPTYPTLVGWNGSTTYGVRVDSCRAADSASNADTCDGLHVGTGVNSSPNEIVRTNASGYCDFGWINTVSGVATGTPVRIYCSQDAYIRYYSPAELAPYILNQGSTKNAHTHTAGDLTGVVSNVYDIAGFYGGKPAANEIMQVVKITRAMTIYNTGSLAACETAATSPTNINVYHWNGSSWTSIGWFTFFAGASTGTPGLNSSRTLAAGDKIKFQMQGSADATLADISWNVIGVLS